MKINLKRYLIYDHLIIFIFYSIAYGLMLINKGVFWDDWMIYNQPYEVIKEAFILNGSPYFAILHKILLLENAILYYRILVFIFFLASAYLLYEILRTIKQVDFYDRFFIVLFFALLPVNFMRLPVIDFPYAFCYFIFFSAWWFIQKYLQENKIILRVISLLLFFISFTTPSFLFFYIIPVYFIYLTRYDYQIKRRKIMLTIRKYPDFILLPLLFYFLKSFFFKPVDLYETYNKINLSIKNTVLVNFDLGFLYSFTFPVKIAIIEPLFYKTGLQVLILLLFAVVFFLIHFKFRSEIRENKFDKYGILIGFLILLIAIFPYLLVGRMPFYEGVDNRHQLLVPLGASLLLYYLVSLICRLLQLKILIKNIVFSLLIAAFIVNNFFTYLEFQQDWFKQLSFIENVKKNETIRINRTFYFVDNTMKYNAINRDNRFYEYNGKMKLAFGDETRFGVERGFGPEIFNSKKEALKFKKYKQFNMSSYNPSGDIYDVYIEYGTYKLNTISTIKLLYWHYTNKKKFEKHIPDIISLKTEIRY